MNILFLRHLLFYFQNKEPVYVFWIFPIRLPFLELIYIPCILHLYIAINSYYNYILRCEQNQTYSWEQRKFVSVFEGLQNNTLSRADLNYENGTVKNVHYGDVLIKFGDYIDASRTDLPYISDDAKADKFKNSFLQDGDIIIADTAEDDTVGKCTEIQGSEGLKLLSGLHTVACRPKEKYGPMFLGYYINSPAYHNQLKPLMQGIKVTSISKSALQDTDMIMPKSIEEQTMIGGYFANLDSLITLQQCKAQKKNPAQSSGFSLETPYSTAYYSTFLTLGGVAVFLSSHDNVAFINTQNSIKTIITRITPLTMILTTLFPM